MNTSHAFADDADGILRCVCGAWAPPRMTTEPVRMQDGSMSSSHVHRGYGMPGGVAKDNPYLGTAFPGVACGAS